MYVVIGAAATRTRRVLWALGEMDLPFEHRPFPPRADEVRALNPSGKVPVLLDGDRVVTDSIAILHHLADRHGRLTHPAGSPERAQQDALTFGIVDEVEGPLWTLAKHKFVLPEHLRVDGLRPAIDHEVGAATARLGDRLADGRPFLTGETFTITDIVAAHCAAWAGSARVAIDRRFDDWAAALRERPAARAAYG